MAKRIPAGEVTPHGWYHLVKGDKPMMWMDAYDKSITFDLLGGLAVTNLFDTPETVQIPRGGLKGLIPPWKHILQKGATQDGATHIDALLDPTEVQLDVVCRGRDWRHTNNLSRQLLDSIDAIQQSSLNFWTHDMGHWWADVRWFQGAPQDPINLTNGGQKWSLRLLADTACWRSYDWTDMFSFDYEDFTDTFTYDTEADGDLGDNWPLYYDESGGGFIYADGSQARWKDDPDDWLGTETREVVAGPYKDFETATDNQVVSMVFGSMQEWSLPQGAANDLWVRMGRNPDGTWDGNGVRARMENNILKLSRFNDFAQTVLWQQIMLLPPLLGEKFSLVAGYDDNPRLFRFLRNGIPIMSHKESGTGSMLGEDYRGVGFGMQAGGAVLTQATPASIRKVSAGDNAQATQTGFVKMVNIGDQKMYWDATLFGPFDKIRLYDGPGSDEYVEFGPLLKNQIVFLRTDPRSNTTLVQDLTSTPPTPQELNIFQNAVKSLISFFSDQNAFTDQIESLFGIRPPQGNFYKYLSGRFSDNAAIPPKSPGVELRDVKPHHVKVEIVGGNADSKVILSGTPLRRNPL